jgi:hypothetical protein
MTSTQIRPLIQQQPVPLLVVPLVHDRRFDISTEKTRALHVHRVLSRTDYPICRTQIGVSML